MPLLRSSSAVRLAVLLLAAGCAHEPAFSRASHPSAADYPHAGAIDLLYEVTHHVDFRDGAGVPWREHIHRQIAIVRPAGLAAAAVEIDVDAETQLVNLHARTVGADGRVHLLPMSALTTVAANLDGVNVPRHRLTTKFTMPAVNVGSVIELDYTKDHARAPMEITGFVGSGQPVRHARVTFEVDKTATSECKVYNLERPIEHVAHGDFIRTSIVYDDLAASGAEAMSPPDVATRPRWAFRILGYVSHGVSRSGMATWKDALAEPARALYPDPTDPIPTRPVVPVEKRTAAIDEALAFVAQRTDLAPFAWAWNEVRSLREVLRTHTASNLEKAVLLHRVLEQQGIRTRYALVVRSRKRALDPVLPTRDGFNHALLLIERQPGIASARFVDPSCEACRGTELPAWSAGMPALLFSLDRANGFSDLTFEFSKLPDEHVTESRRSTSWALTVEPSGAVNARVEIELSGPPAAEGALLERLFGADLVAQETRSFLELLPGAKVELHHAPYDKSSYRASLSGTVSSAKYATADPDRLVIPLNVLERQQQASSEAPRRSHVWVDRRAEEIEHVEIRVPAGWRVEQVPAARSRTAPGMELSCTVEQHNGVVELTRTSRWLPGDWPPSTWPAVAAALDDVRALRDEVVVLRRQR